MFHGTRHRVVTRGERAADPLGHRDTGVPATEINGIVADWIGSLSRDEVMQRCLAGEVPIGPLNSIADIFDDPQIQARGNLLRVEDPRVGEVVVPNVVPRLSATPGRFGSLGPDLGQHNDEIYGDRLGFSDDEVASLRADGVI